MTKAEDTRPHLSGAFTSLGHAPFVQPSSYLRPPMASQPERPIDVEERQGLVSVLAICFLLFFLCPPVLSTPSAPSTPSLPPPPRTEAFCRPSKMRKSPGISSQRSPLLGMIRRRIWKLRALQKLNLGMDCSREKGITGTCEPRPSSWRPVSRS